MEWFRFRSIYDDLTKWEECENYARQAVKALPSNKQKLLPSPEAYRIAQLSLEAPEALCQRETERWLA